MANLSQIIEYFNGFIFVVERTIVSSVGRNANDPCVFNHRAVAADLLKC